jgi:hypothetical protein
MQILRAAGVHAPSLVQLGGRYHVFSRTKLISSGDTVYAALDAGGFLEAENAPRELYVAFEDEVVQSGEVAARAKSKTMAQRIANALNEYIPGRRGF